MADIRILEKCFYIFNLFVSILYTGIWCKKLDAKTLDLDILIDITPKRILPVVGYWKFVPLKMFVTSFGYISYFMRKFNLSMSMWHEFDPFDR